MRFGALEIGIVIVIILIIIGITRLRKVGQNNTEVNKTSARVERRGEGESKRTRHPRLQILSIIVVLAGILVLLTSLNLIKWVVWGSIGACVIVAIGLVTFFIVRRS